uniref:Uncharacterized protein n=1 Tax=Siphoviridae sp. ctxS04 TaxID=2823610 RepID=A0A8S5LH85_9CAUD|nr:MAG TPA: hypothetical protein [Siphoviridae sp. ctxS04]
MPWRTFWGYINGNSERFQVFVPAQKEISRDVQNICDLNQHIIVRFTITRFIVLIGSKG